MEHPKISKKHFSSQNMLSVFADILRKKFWGTEGKSTRSLGCISTSTYKNNHRVERNLTCHQANNQRETHKDSCSSRISPTQQRLQPLPLCCQVTQHRLHPCSNDPQSIISPFKNFTCLPRWYWIKLFIKFIFICCISMRQVGIHMGRKSWSLSIAPKPS